MLDYELKILIDNISKLHNLNLHKSKISSLYSVLDKLKNDLFKINQNVSFTSYRTLIILNNAQNIIHRNNILTSNAVKQPNLSTPKQPNVSVPINNIQVLPTNIQEQPKDNMQIQPKDNIQIQPKDNIQVLPTNIQEQPNNNDISEQPKNSDIPEQSKTSDIPEQSKTSDIPEILNIPEQPKNDNIPETLNIPEQLKTSDISEILNISEQPNNNISEQPNIPDEITEEKINDFTNNLDLSETIHNLMKSIDKSVSKSVSKSEDNVNNNIFDKVKKRKREVNMSYEKNVSKKFKFSLNFDDMSAIEAEILDETDLIIDSLFDVTSEFGMYKCQFNYTGMQQIIHNLCFKEHPEIYDKLNRYIEGINSSGKPHHFKDIILTAIIMITSKLRKKDLTKYMEGYLQTLNTGIWISDKDGTRRYISKVIQLIRSHSELTNKCGTLSKLLNVLLLSI
jgi:hypothetical protein